MKKLFNKKIDKLNVCTMVLFFLLGMFVMWSYYNQDRIQRALRPIVYKVVVALR